MHVALVQYIYEKCSTPQELLHRHFTILDWARALTHFGLKVSVIYRYDSNHQFTQEGISYVFIKDNLPPSPKPYHLAFSFYNKVKRIVGQKKVDVVHVHNLLATSSNFIIRRLIRNKLIVIQDHGSTLKSDNSLKSKLLRAVLRFSLLGIDGFMFAAKGQEISWVEQKIITNKCCYFVMENSSHFTPEDRGKSRAITEIKGEPVFLWVGNLDQNKDPITALRAFIQVFKHFPDAKLHMIYRLDSGESEVRNFISQYPSLKDNVVLHGSKPRNELSNYYNSADYFVSASHKEGSGYAAIEAMSCGVVPVLSDIPSFFSLTKNGKVGVIFEKGNSQMLFEQIIKLTKKEIGAESKKVFSHFQQYLSFDVIAQDAYNVYNKLVEK